jgi:hypothetical protein
MQAFVIQKLAVRKFKSILRFLKNLIFLQRSEIYFEYLTIFSQDCKYGT